MYSIVAELYHELPEVTEDVLQVRYCQIHVLVMFAGCVVMDTTSVSCGPI